LFTCPRRNERMRLGAGASAVLQMLLAVVRQSLHREPTTAIGIVRDDIGDVIRGASDGVITPGTEQSGRRHTGRQGSLEAPFRSRQLMDLADTLL
jgi:hypothetical protein